MAIQIKGCVRFKIIPFEMLAVFKALILAGESQGVDPVITGASYENYPIGKVHDRGYAVDVRTSNLPNPAAFAISVSIQLGAVSPYYVVLYGDRQHCDHIHIGFSWWFSRDETRRRLENGKS